MLNETKINDFAANNLFNQLINYKFLHKQRSEKNGAGGVAILFKAEIQFKCPFKQTSCYRILAGRP